MTVLCPKCQQIYTPTAKQAARGATRGEWICSPCCNARRRVYLAKRAAAGLPKFASPIYPLNAKRYRDKCKTIPKHRELRRLRDKAVRSRPGFGEKSKARDAIRRAIKRGRMVRPLECSKCGSGGNIQAHHWKGYAKEFRLDVQWLCPRCHWLADAKAAHELATA